jgi:hypothetical protein
MLRNEASTRRGRFSIRSRAGMSKHPAKAAMPVSTPKSNGFCDRRPQGFAAAMSLDLPCKPRSDDVTTMAGATRSQSSDRLEL